MSTLSRSHRAVVLTFLLALVLPLGASVALAVTPDEDAEAAAVAFLVTSYEDHPDTFGFGIGSSNDLVFALAGTGLAGDVASRALAELEAAADSYLTSTGAVAKTHLAVAVGGGDPNTFAGRDLEAELRAAMAADGSFDPYAFNQANAVLALMRTEAGVPPEALDWLADQQCPDGSVGNDFDEDGAPDCPGDVDTTALVVQAYAAGGLTTPAEAAIAWLLSQQAADGSFSNFGANPNSTGLAAQALRAAGHTAEADLAAAWVADQQHGCDAEEGPAGAIASPHEGLGSTEFATVQGVLAFGAASFDQLDATVAAAAAPTLTCPAGEDDAQPAPVTDGDTEPATDADADAEAEELPATGPDELWLVVIAGVFLLAGARLVASGRTR